MSQDIHELIRRIHADFPIFPVPDKELVRSETYAVNQYLAGKSWPEVNVSGILGENFDSPESYMTFIGDEGYRYYLPAYMRMTLVEMNDENGWLLETIISGLHKDHYQYTLQKEDGSLVRVDNFAQRFSPFSLEQKRDIADFLQHQIRHYGPKPVNYVRDNVLEVYKSYWHQFASDKTAQE